MIDLIRRPRKSVLMILAFGLIAVIFHLLNLSLLPRKFDSVAVEQDDSYGELDVDESPTPISGPHKPHPLFPKKPPRVIKRRMAVLVIALGVGTVRRALAMISSLELSYFVELSQTEVWYYVFLNEDQISQKMLVEELGDEETASRVDLTYFNDKEITKGPLDLPHRCSVLLASQKLTKAAKDYDFIATIDIDVRFHQNALSDAENQEDMNVVPMHLAFFNRTWVVDEHPQFRVPRPDRIDPDDENFKEDVLVARKRFPIAIDLKAACFNNDYEKAEKVKFYYGGHIFGSASSERFFDACQSMTKCWRQDLDRGIWLLNNGVNEAYLNHFLIENQLVFDEKSPLHSGLSELLYIEGMMMPRRIDKAVTRKLPNPAFKQLRPLEIHTVPPGYINTVSPISQDTLMCLRMRWRLSGDQVYVAGGSNYTSKVENDTFADEMELFKHVGASNLTLKLDEADLVASSDRRSSQANLLYLALVEKYLKRMEKVMKWLEGDPENQKLSSHCPPHFLFFTCNPRVSLCGGYGDRTRGLLSAFAAAIGSRRIFHIDWSKNTQLADYFQINSAFYADVSNETYERMVRSALHEDQDLQHARNFMDSAAENALVKWAAQPLYRLKYGHFKTLIMSGNTMAGLEGALKNPSFKPLWRELVANLNLTDGNFANTSLDVSIFASAMLRIIFGKPQPRLADLVDKCIVEAPANSWNESYKIGMQIRMLRPDWSEGGERVTKAHLPCFVEELAKIARHPVTIKRMKNLNLTKIIVFVTSDNENAVGIIKNLILKDPDLAKLVTPDRIYSTNDTCGKELKLTHSDREEVAEDSATPWHDMARPFVDWLGLTLMDRLLISRSGFAESASLFSLKPTSRLVTYNSTERCPFRRFNELSHSEKGIRFESGL